MRSLIHLLWRGGGATALLLLALPLSAQTVRPEPLQGPSNLEELARLSDVVVVGRVVRNSSRWVGKVIVTTSEVRTLETFKGQPPSLLEVSFLGGTVGVIHQDATHEPTLTEGEVAVLFLAAPPPSPQGRPQIEGLRIVAEDGKLPLLAPGEPESRLKNDRRLQRFLREVAERVTKGGPQR